MMTIVYGVDEYGEEVYTVMKDGEEVGGVFLSDSHVQFEYYGSAKDDFICVHGEECYNVSDVLTAEQALEKAIELGWDK